MLEVLRDKKVIFFDIGYTLDYPASGDWFFVNKFNEIAGNRLCDISSERIIEAGKKAMDYLEKNHLVKDEEEKMVQFIHYYSDISRLLNLNLSEQEIEAVAYDKTYNMDNYIPYPDVKDTIETLSKTFKLGIISDTWPGATKQLKLMGIENYFSSLTFSCDLGVFKPDERMYIDALKKMECKPEDAVFIDDVVINLEGAAKMGITPILITRENAPKAKAGFATIKTLEELVK